MKRFILIMLVFLTALIPTAGQTWGIMVVGGGVTASGPPKYTPSSASDDCHNGSNTAANTIDGNTSTGYSSFDCSGDPHRHLTYDFGSGNSYAINYIRIYHTDVYVSEHHTGIKDFVIEGSNDNFSTHTDLANKTATEHGASPTWEEFHFTNSTAYRYIRIDTSSTYDTYANIVAYKEIEFYVE